jgi:murein DD-endopeptidase MepM/ murein hydrolase activator NlpD
MMVPFASKYENEPNNTSTTATSTNNGDDNYGNFSSSTDTEDWWKFTLTYRAYVNLFLGNIPSGSDYDLRLYSSSNTTTPIWSGVNTGTANELLINKDLESGTYYLKVTKFSGSSTTSYYSLRWKINQHWPVLWTTTINSGFQTPSRPTHNGIDINFTVNNPTSETDKCNGGNQCYYANNIAATWDGVVSNVSNPANPSTGYGRVVYINHNVNGAYYQTRYAHLHSINVSNGATIKAGDIIGVMGNTGGVSGTTGTHLHYEVLSALRSIEWLTPNYVDS